MYDVLFVGQLCYDEDLRADGTRHESIGGAAGYGAIAATVTAENVGALIKLAPEDEKDLEYMRDRGVAMHTLPSPVTTRVQISHPTGKADERKIVTLAFAGKFTEEEAGKIPPAKHVHLAGCNDHDFTMEFMEAVKAQGSTLSVDMQCFVRRNDPELGEMIFTDDPDKEKVVALMDKIKLDVLEANMLTGTDNLEEASAIIAGWGCPEVVITREDGVHARVNGQCYFEKFSNKRLTGRTGRGDTTFGAYLGRRVDHDPAESLQFAAALVSLKMEGTGPFSGTLDDVLERMAETKG
jgi:sugar/nucleoside kinase (ribokinase family)